MSANINVDFEDILKKIAGELRGNEVVHNLGKALGFESADIARFNEENMRHGVSYMGTLNMLRTWRQRQRQAEEKKMLKAALNKAGFVHMVDEDLFADDVEQRPRPTSCASTSQDESSQYSERESSFGKTSENTEEDAFDKIATAIWGKITVNSLRAILRLKVDENAQEFSKMEILKAFQDWRKGQIMTEPRDNLKAALEKADHGHLGKEYLSADDVAGRSTGPEFPQKKETGQGPSGGQTLSQEPKETIDHPLLDDESSKLQGDVASGSMEQHSEEVSHQITADLDGTHEDLSADGKKVHWEFLTERPKLTLQDDEVVISCGIRFSPSGAKLSKPIKVTLDHNAHFNNPRRAEIIFYTRNKDSETFERIPAFTDGSYPRCDVRAKDLDLYVDHFSIWWIVVKINQYFFGKRVNCAPYVRPPVMKGSTHLVLLCIYDDLSEVIEKIDKEMAGYEQLHPPQLMIVKPNRCDINIELFEGLKENEEKIGEKKIGSRVINRLDRTKISFAVRQLESEVGQRFLKFTLDQEESSCSPTLIEFELRYDDVTTTTATGAELVTMPASSQAVRVSTSTPSGEGGDQVEPDENGYYTQLMKPATPSPEQLNPEQNYKMDALTKGHMFILNIREDRDGSDVDVRNIEHVFKQIGFEIETHPDLTAKELQDKLGEFVDCSRHEGMCSVVFLFMAHGNMTHIKCTDGKVSIQFIMEKVYGMKSMNGRPKMIFFQCCRRKADEKKVTPDQAERDIARPIKSDVLVAYPTTQGDIAYRDEVRGSWFIQMLCEKLLENAHDSDLVTILQQVTGKVRGIAATKNRNQCPVIVQQTISKKIYFLPKFQRIAENE